MAFIGIAGQRQVGKDTTANKLKESLNSKLKSEYWKRSSFAYNVKKIFCDTFDFDPDLIDEWKIKDEVPNGIDIPVRQALIEVGNGFRKIRSSIWIDLIFKDKSPQIISDVRFINELVATMDHNGYNVLIVNPNKINYDPAEQELLPLILWAINNPDVIIPPKDAFERLGAPISIKYINYILWNDKSIEDLYRKIDNDLLLDIAKNFSLSF